MKCVEKWLFNVKCFTIRNKVSQVIESNENGFDAKLLKKVDTVEYKGKICGRTDIAILNVPAENVLHVTRQDVKVAVEVKPASQFNDGAMKESLTQLIGLNVANGIRNSPVVILTDLTKHFYVYNIEIMCEDPLKYCIRITPCSNFETAIELSLELYNREGCTKDFGRPPTPPGKFSESVENDSLFSIDQVVDVAE